MVYQLVKVPSSKISYTICTYKVSNIHDTIFNRVGAVNLEAQCCLLLLALAGLKLGGALNLLYLP